MKYSFHSYVALSLVVVGASACRVGSSDTCPSGAGITAVPFTGDQLAERTIALTFDGGPSDISQELGEYLFANNVQAAFFVVGRAVADDDGPLSAFKDFGHLVGNLGYSGKDLAAVPDPVAEVRRTDALITPYVTGGMFLFRAPDGHIDRAVADALNDDGLDKYVGHVHWDVGDSDGNFILDSDCWATGISPSNCAQGYLGEIRVQKSGIVRLHDTDARTLALVRDIVPQLKSEGFTFARIDAVPALKRELEKAGATPGLVGGGRACNDYD